MWIITKDRTNAEEIGLESRLGWTSSDNDGSPLPYKFRMCDDDGVVYYKGLSSSNDDEDAFNPLDELGTPDAGCTYIEYLVDGKWEML